MSSNCDQENQCAGSPVTRPLKSPYMTTPNNSVSATPQLKSPYLSTPKSSASASSRRRKGPYSSAGVRSAFKSPFRKDCTVATPQRSSNDDVNNSNIDVNDGIINSSHGDLAHSNNDVINRKNDVTSSNADVTTAMKNVTNGNDVLRHSLDELTSQISTVDQEIQLLQQEGIEESELKVHIDKLHEYNELKDTAQMVLGRIAYQEGMTTRELYARFGLDLDD